jgi:hypothetical protein
MNIQDLYDRLEKHDWTFAFSDDPSVYRRGVKAQDALKAQARATPGGEALYQAFHDYIFSGPAFGTRPVPKPERPVSKPVRHIDAWSLVPDPRPDVYTPPECRETCLYGSIDGSPNWLTTGIVGRTADGAVMTKNTKYTLGEIHPEYEEAFPDTRRRLFDRLPLVEG